MSDPCNKRFTTWIAQKIGGSMLGEVVVAEDYDAAQSELAALREELAMTSALLDGSNESHLEWRRKLTAAEQRNAELVELLREVQKAARKQAWAHGYPTLFGMVDAALKPAEGGGDGM